MNNIDKQYFDFFKSCLENDRIIDFDGVDEIAKNINFEYFIALPLAFKANMVKTERKRITKNRIKYANLFNKYKNILDKTTVLAKELKLTNSLEFSLLYNYLLKKGYFSINKNLKYDDNIKNVAGLEALDIMTGKGVCLNFSLMLKHFLNNSGFDSAIIHSCTVYKNAILQNLFNTNTKMNHASNLIIENDKMYIYDSTNERLLKIKNIHNAKIVIGLPSKKLGMYSEKNFKKFKLYPYDSYLFNSNTKSITALDIFNCSNNFDSPYNKDTYEKINKHCIEYFKQNNHLISDYYDCTKKHINDVAKGVSLIKTP